MPEPDQPLDGKVQELRERALDLLAGASVHAQRLQAAAARLGLTPDLVDGVGDQLYEAAVAQLDIAAKILERSQAIADRLLDLGARREPSRLVRIDVAPGAPAQLRFTVRNASTEAAQVAVDAAWDGGVALAPRIGRPRLAGGRETSVEIAIAPAQLARGQIYAGTARVTLTYEPRRVVEMPRHDFEIWVGA